MGNKGGDTAAPPPVTAAPANNDMAMMEMMMAMMSSMGSMETPDAPTPIDAPEVVESTPIDWATQMEDLGAKATYDADDAADERKGRLSTIHSSLTDDDEDTEMTTSLLG